MTTPYKIDMVSLTIFPILLHHGDQKQKCISELNHSRRHPEEQTRKSMALAELNPINGKLLLFPNQNNNSFLLIGTRIKGALIAI